MALQRTDETCLPAGRRPCHDPDARRRQALLPPDSETIRSVPQRLGEAGGQDTARARRPPDQGAEGQDQGAAASLPHGHPDQLRHNSATNVRRELNPDAAQVLLGHNKADVTQVYAQQGMNRAVAMAAKVG